MEWLLDLDLESHEVQPQYQDVELDPLHLNLKHVTNHHHQKLVEEWLYLLMLWMVVVIVDFTTLGESHLYGLPLSLCRLLRPLGPFFSFDVSLTIPINM